jgi:hypothetical protein
VAVRAGRRLQINRRADNVSNDPRGVFEKPSRGFCCKSFGQQSLKLNTRVRFPSPAPDGATVWKSRSASTRAKCDFDSDYLMARDSIARTVTHAGIGKVRRARFRHAVTRASEITWSSECRQGWPFCPDRIADQLGIGAHQLVAFLLSGAYLFRTVFPWLFAGHRTASDRYPLRVSAGCRESTWMM